MTVRDIRRIGDPVLRTPADPVTAFDAALRALVQDLLDTVVAAPGRAAVAAPQIGVGLRVFGYDTAGARGHLVNPVIVERDGEQVEDEGCLSLPGLGYPTARAERVTVTGFDQDGAPVTMTVSGHLARMVQHETDHLDGILYVDRLTGDARRQALRAVRSGTVGAGRSVTTVRRSPR